jgi:hypothetical protein
VSWIVRVGLVLTLAAAALGLGACGLIPRPAPALVIPAAGDVRELPLVIVDPAGLVRSVAAGGPHVAFDFGVERIAGSETSAAVHWLGGMCDIQATAALALTGNVIEISLATDERFGACPAAGVPRTVTIDFAEPIAGRTLDLVAP